MSNGSRPDRHRPSAPLEAEFRTGRVDVHARRPAIAGAEAAAGTPSRRWRRSHPRKSRRWHSRFTRLIAGMEPPQISEGDFAKDGWSILKRVETGAEVIIHRDAHPVAVLRPAEPARPKISECIALLPADATDHRSRLREGCGSRYRRRPGTAGAARLGPMIDSRQFQAQDPPPTGRIFYSERLAFKMIRSASTSVIITVMGSTGEATNP
jgi:antitoxin (DNA-binding transcriptional repressor) of toxin-antitoxin stability system